MHKGLGCEWEGEALPTAMEGITQLNDVGIRPPPSLSSSSDLLRLLPRRLTENDDDLGASIVGDGNAIAYIDDECRSLLNFSDKNFSHELDRREYADFVDQLSGGLITNEGTSAIPPLSEFSKIFRVNFQLVTCECMTLGGTDGCCDPPPLFIDISGAGPFEDPTAEQALYLSRVCEKTRAAIAHEFGFGYATRFPNPTAAEPSGVGATPPSPSSAPTFDPTENATAGPKPETAVRAPSTSPSMGTIVPLPSPPSTAAPTSMPGDSDPGTTPPPPTSFPSNSPIVPSLFTSDLGVEFSYVVSMQIAEETEGESVREKPVADDIATALGLLAPVVVKETFGENGARALRLWAERPRGLATPSVGFQQDFPPTADNVADVACPPEVTARFLCSLFTSTVTLVLEEQADPDAVADVYRVSIVDAIVADGRLVDLLLESNPDTPVDGIFGPAPSQPASVALSNGAIGGISTASVVFALAVFFLVRWRRKDRKSPPQRQPPVLIPFKNTVPRSRGVMEPQPGREAIFPVSEPRSGRIHLWEPKRARNRSEGGTDRFDDDRADDGEVMNGTAEEWASSGADIFPQGGKEADLDKYLDDAGIGSGRIGARAQKGTSDAFSSNIDMAYQTKGKEGARDTKRFLTDAGSGVQKVFMESQDTVAIFPVSAPRSNRLHLWEPKRARNRSEGGTDSFDDKWTEDGEVMNGTAEEWASSGINSVSITSSLGQERDTNLTEVGSSAIIEGRQQQAAIEDDVDNTDIYNLSQLTPYWSVASRMTRGHNAADSSELTSTYSLYHNRDVRSSGSDTSDKGGAAIFPRGGKEADLDANLNDAGIGAGSTDARAQEGTSDAFSSNLDMSYQTKGKEGVWDTQRFLTDAGIGVQKVFLESQDTEANSAPPERPLNKRDRLDEFEIRAQDTAFNLNLTEC